MRKFSHFLALLLCILTIQCACLGPVMAADGFDISVDGTNGITINPGNYPDLGATDIDGIQDAATEKIIDKGKAIAQTITAICAIICFVAFLFNVVKLTTAGSAPFQRRTGLTGIMWSGVGLALFGGAFVVVSFFWNFLR